MSFQPDIVFSKAQQWSEFSTYPSENDCHGGIREWREAVCEPDTWGVLAIPEEHLVGDPLDNRMFVQTFAGLTIRGRNLHVDRISVSIKTLLCDSERRTR